jgi:peptide/nickel transport system permease protein
VSRRALVSFVIRRVLILGLLLVVVSFAIFSLMALAPGNPLDLLQPDPALRNPESIRALTKQYHLDDPFLTQYWLWVKQAAQFKFGNSIQTTLPVSGAINGRLPISLFLGVYAYVITMVVGVTLGIGAALKRQKSLDRGIVAGAIVGLSMPAFVSGVLAIYVFAVILHWFPAAGSGAGFLDELWHMTLPAFALALTCIALLVKHTRAAMLKTLEKDYITFARARGLSSRRVLFAYALRNALIPVITVSAPLLAFMITGAVFVETAFSLPGIGNLLVQSALSKDLPMLQGVAMLVAALILAANLLADLLYLVVDPRIRLGQRGT